MAKKPAAPKESAPPAKRGRPSSFTQEAADAVCARLEVGEGLCRICETEGFPSRPTVMRWLDDPLRAEFRAQYARARDAGLDYVAEEIMRIADTPQVGTKSVSKATGLEITEADMIDHRRLQVEARKWYLSKLAPKRYGDKLELAGAITVNKSAADMTDDELAAVAARNAPKS